MDDQVKVLYMNDAYRKYEDTPMGFLMIVLHILGNFLR